MAESKMQNQPPFRSTDELIEYFDTHDMGDYLEDSPEVHFEVDLQRRTHLVAIDEEVANRLDEIAKLQHVSAEVLVNAWLKEKLSGYTEGV